MCIYVFEPTYMCYAQALAANPADNLQTSVYTFTRICIHTYIYIHIRIHNTQTPVAKPTDKREYIWAYMYTNIYIYTNNNTQRTDPGSKTRRQACVHLHIYSICIYLHTYIYTYKYTTHRPRQQTPQTNAYRYFAMPKVEFLKSRVFTQSTIQSDKRANFPRWPWSVLWKFSRVSSPSHWLEKVAIALTFLEYLLCMGISKYSR